jgi:hypothetical protein
VIGPERLSGGKEGWGRRWLEAMEGMEEKLQRLKLSAAEKKGIEVDVGDGDGEDRQQALGKLLSERPAHPDALIRALGRIWCPIRGIDCKILGENLFLFTFHQPSGKRKAMEEGPWMFSNELLVIADLDEMKAVEEIEFTHVPIWIRVAKLPIGMMNRSTGEVIGNEVGEFLELDVSEGESMVGNSLRIKIRLDIREPLMRGVTIRVGKEKKEKWCPISYEHLPDFCYVCGRLGHTEKMCSIKLKPGEQKPFDKSLRFQLEGGARWEHKGNWGARSGSSSDRGSGSRGSRWLSNSSRSDGPSWRKNLDELKDDAISPHKKEKTLVIKDATMAKRSLVLNKEQEEREGCAVILNERLQSNDQGDASLRSQENSSMQAMHVGDTSVMQQGSVETREKGSKKGGRGFRRLQRDVEGDGGKGEKVLGDGKAKRGAEEMDVDVRAVAPKRKKGFGGELEGKESLLTGDVSQIEAGLSEQPCKKQ